MERKFTRGLNKPGMAAQLRESVSQVVRESAVLVSFVFVNLFASPLLSLFLAESEFLVNVCVCFCHCFCSCAFAVVAFAFAVVFSFFLLRVYFDIL